MYAPNHVEARSLFPNIGLEFGFVPLLLRTTDLKGEEAPKALPLYGDSKPENVSLSHGHEVVVGQRSPRHLHSMSKQSFEAIRVVLRQKAVGDSEDIDRIIDDLVSIRRVRAEAKSSAGARS